MNIEQMHHLVEELAVVKSRQDVEAALKLQHQEMLLECPPFKSKAKGHNENRIALSAFFRTFPDYSITLENYAANENEFAAWGTAKMTLANNWLGLSPNGNKMSLLVFLKFTFKENLIASERFSFDLSELCSQSGISTDEVRRQLFKSAA